MNTFCISSLLMKTWSPSLPSKLKWPITSKRSLPPTSSTKQPYSSTLGRKAWGCYPQLTKTLSLTTLVTKSRACHCEHTSHVTLLTPHLLPSVPAMNLRNLTISLQRRERLGSLNSTSSMLCKVQSLCYNGGRIILLSSQHCLWLLVIHSVLWHQVPQANATSVWLAKLSQTEGHFWSPLV